jgi:hypothetical protein
VLSAGFRSAGESVEWQRRDTLVTAVYDLNSTSELGGRDRPIAYYFPSLRSIGQLGAGLIVYTRPAHVQTLSQYLYEIGAPAVVVGRELEPAPHFARIQEIRIRQRFHEQPWRDRCHVLCHAKIAWLAEQAERDPFHSQQFYWIDAGLAYPGLFPLRYLPDYLGGPCAAFRPAVLDALATGAERGGQISRDLVMIGMQPIEGRTIHQMTLEEHLPFVGDTDGPMSIHVVGALFGGSPDAVRDLYGEYDRVLSDMLNADRLGTEENVLTILYHRAPSRIRLLTFSTWYHEDSDVRHPGHGEVPFYRIFEQLVAPSRSEASASPSEPHTIVPACHGSLALSRSAERLKEMPAQIAAHSAELWHPRVADELQWREEGDLFLLACGDDERVHVLNNVGALLLELSNGRHSPGEMAGILQEVFHLDQAPLDEVQDFLDRAQQSGLVK